MDLKQIKFQYYNSDIRSTKALGTLSLYDLLYSIKNPKDEIVEIFKQIEKAAEAGDKKLKAKLKEGLYFMNPCIMTDGKGRGYENIVSWTSLLIIDVDNLDKDFAIELKQHLFETYPFVIASMLSSSRAGVKAIIHIPQCFSVDEFKSYFYGLMDEWQYYKNIDTTSKNCSLPFYLTYDRELLYRTDATQWTGKGIQIDEFTPYEGEIIPVENVSDEDIEFIKNILRKMYSSITDTGHLIVRNSGLICGGYVSAYGLDIDEMRDFLFELIDDTPYLQKSLKTYKKTVSDMILRGMQAPLYLHKEDER